MFWLVAMCSLLLYIVIFVTGFTNPCYRYTNPILCITTFKCHALNTFAPNTLQRLGQNTFAHPCFIIWEHAQHSCICKPKCELMHQKLCICEIFSHYKMVLDRCGHWAFSCTTTSQLIQVFESASTSLQLLFSVRILLHHIHHLARCKTELYLCTPSESIDRKENKAAGSGSWIAPRHPCSYQSK